MTPEEYWSSEGIRFLNEDGTLPDVEQRVKEGFRRGFSEGIKKCQDETARAMQQQAGAATKTLAVVAVLLLSGCAHGNPTTHAVKSNIASVRAELRKLSTDTNIVAFKKQVSRQLSEAELNLEAVQKTLSETNQDRDEWKKKSESQSEDLATMVERMRAAEAKTSKAMFHSTKLIFIGAAGLSLLAAALSIQLTNFALPLLRVPLILIFSAATFAASWLVLARI